VFLGASKDDFNPVEYLYDKYAVWTSLWDAHGTAFVNGWNEAMPFQFLHISQHVIMVWIATALIIGVFSYVTFVRNTRVPKGLRNFIEPIVTYLRDEVVRPSINNPHPHHGDGDHHHEEHPPHWLADKFVPFFVCMFFFIVTINLLSLIPGASQPTTALTFTFAMAAITLGVYGVGAVWMSIKQEGGVVAGVLGFFKNMVPYQFSWKPMDFTVWMLLLFIEFAGFIFIKPFALAVRLFANMTAGNCSMLSFLFINLLIPEGSEYLRIATGIPTVLVGVALYAFEIFVSILQAYIFTYLSAIFLGLYLVPEH
jgi:F-type H+-transporting ATPase subunit a